MTTVTVFEAHLREAWLRVRAWVRRCVGTLRGVLGEIFDESAYARFLERRGLESSRNAYADFLREGQAARERRARCC